MKKIIAILLTLLMLVTLIPVGAFAENDSAALTDVAADVAAADTAVVAAETAATSANSDILPGSVPLAETAVEAAEKAVDAAQSAAASAAGKAKSESVQAAANDLPSSVQSDVKNDLDKINESETTVAGALDAVDVSKASEYLEQAESDIKDAKGELDTASGKLLEASGNIANALVVELQVSGTVVGAAFEAAKQAGTAQTQAGAAEDAAAAASDAADNAKVAAASAAAAADEDAAAVFAAAAAVALADAEGAVDDAKAAKAEADKAAESAAEAYAAAQAALDKIKAELGITDDDLANSETAVLLKEAIEAAEAAKGDAEAAAKAAADAQKVLSDAEDALKEAADAANSVAEKAALSAYVDASTLVSMPALVKGAAAELDEAIAVPSGFSLLDSFFVVDGKVYTVSGKDQNYTVTQSYAKTAAPADKNALSQNYKSFYVTKKDDTHGNVTELLRVEKVSLPIVGTKYMYGAHELKYSNSNGGYWYYKNLSGDKVKVDFYQTVENGFSFTTENYNAKIQAAAKTVKDAAGAVTDAKDGAFVQYETALLALESAQAAAAVAATAATAAADTAAEAQAAAQAALDNYNKLVLFGCSVEVLEKAKADAEQAQSDAEAALGLAEQKAAEAKQAKAAADAAVARFNEVVQTGGAANDPASIAERLLGDAYAAAAAAGETLSSESFVSYVFNQSGSPVDLSGTSLEAIIAANGIRLDTLERGALVIVLNDDGSIAGFGIAISATQFIMYNEQTGRVEIFNAAVMNVVAVRRTTR